LLMVQKAKDLNISVDGEVAKRLAEMQVMAKITDPTNSTTTSATTRACRLKS